MRMWRVARCVECDRTMSLVVESVARGFRCRKTGSARDDATWCDATLRRRCAAVARGRRHLACARSPTFHGMPTRGVTFARYLRKVHIEWCPFKPKAVGPVFFGEIHTKQIFDAVPKLAITKALVVAPTKEGAPFVDQAKFTFADGSEKTLDFTGIHVRDVLEELDGENVRIQVEERKRGRPFS